MCFSCVFQKKMGGVIRSNSKDHAPQETTHVILTPDPWGRCSRHFHKEGIGIDHPDQVLTIVQ